MEIRKSSILNGKGLLLQFRQADRIFYGEYSPWLHLGYSNLESFNEKSPHFQSLLAIEERLGDIQKESISFSAHQLIKDKEEIILPIHKVKLHTNNPKQSARKVKEFLETKDIRIRLDFNEKWTPESVLSFWNELGEDRRSIEYIEDPTSYNESDWLYLANKGIPLAIDHPFNRNSDLPEFISTVIFRPYYSAIWENKLEHKKVILTQNFTHPWSYYISSLYTLFYPQIDTGLFPPSGIIYKRAGNQVTLDLQHYKEMIHSFKDLNWKAF